PAGGQHGGNTGSRVIPSMSRAWPMTTKFPLSPLLGYNNNVRHKGKVFHVQTEDSGVKYGHIITHLFMDGGRIVKSVKTSYAEYVSSDRVSEVVREMMKQQHKAMFIALRDGKFDSAIDGAEPVRSSESLAAQPGIGAPSQVANARPSAVVSAVAGAAPQAVVLPRPPGVGAGPVAPSREMAMDIEAIERAATIPPAPIPRVSDLPPPPANLFSDKRGPRDLRDKRGQESVGNYRMTDVQGTSQPLAAQAKGPVAKVPPPPATFADSGASTTERRYAPTRPASIFGQAKPEQGRSIFGEDLIGDKSLDEVILSYLAEDLDAEKGEQAAKKKKK
ncbi:MAG: hypothetical protein ACREJ3_03325, partial [Polyangiaceae bacterium]